MPTYYVYRLTCTHPASREKHYYGSRGWSSSPRVKEAIPRYSLAAFQKKIIVIYATRSEAILQEIRLPATLNVPSPLTGPTDMRQWNLLTTLD